MKVSATFGLMAWIATVTSSGLSSAQSLPDKQIITNSIGMKLVYVPSGEFTMGLNEPAEHVLQDFPYEAPAAIADESPAHRVRITRSFYLGQYEVTLGQFLKFYHEAKYQLEADRDGKEDYGYSNTKLVKSTNFRPWAPGWYVANDYPAVYISWNDAQAFCKWLSEKENRTYRLPTEAEWEYACRAGSKSRFSYGDNTEQLIYYGNVPDVSRYEYSPTEVIVTFPPSGGKHSTHQPFPFLQGRDGYVYTAPVGRFRPNAFGLYDMHGNAREWCSDHYSSKYYAHSPTDDPKGPDTGSQRVTRGGAFGSPPFEMRSSTRIPINPSTRRFSVGFRVVYDPQMSFNAQLPIELINN